MTDDTDAPDSAATTRLQESIAGLEPGEQREVQAFIEGLTAPSDHDGRLQARVDRLDAQLDRIIDLLIPTLDEDLAEQARTLRSRPVAS